MTTASVSVNDVRFLPNGSVHVLFSNGTDREFTDRDEVIAAAGDVVSVELAQNLLIAHWIANTPDASSAAGIIGKLLEVDIASELHPVSIGDAD